MNCLKTWAARPAQYKEEVHEAAPLDRYYVEPPRPESRLKGAPVADVAHGIDVWMQGWWHRRWERRPFRFTVWVIVAVVVASLFEIIPTFLIRSNIPTIATVKPYTPLELAGRDIYLSEGCYNCHSQMIRPILSETKRYGEYSKPGEFVYDHPFQWGSRRIGPDLAREGGNRSALWHVLHFEDPRQVIEGSIMPAYPYFQVAELDFETIPSHMRVMQKLGVPYSDTEISQAVESARQQAVAVAAKVEKDQGPTGLETKQVVALIAYLERLGVDLFASPAPPANGPETAQAPAGDTAR
ncbi:MAG: cytochrome-c oxidase, cbb3-type subunit II [Pirellulaceae bacterium]